MADARSAPQDEKRPVCIIHTTVGQHFNYGRELMVLTNAMNALIFETIKFFTRTIKINPS